MSAQPSSREGDDFLHWLVECVLDDLAENVRNRFLNLFVDAQLYVLFGVDIDEFLGLVALSIENFAVTVLFHVEHVWAADKVAVASVDRVAAFLIHIPFSSGTLTNEAWGFTQHLLLTIELVAAEVSWYLEGLGVISCACTGRCLTEVTRSGSGLVGLEDLGGDHWLSELLLNTSVGNCRRNSCLSVIYVTAPLIDVAIGLISVHVLPWQACLVVVLADISLNQSCGSQSLILRVLLSA